MSQAPVRYFVAAFPTTPLAASIHRLAESKLIQWSPKSRPISADRLHLTLAYLGEFDSRDETLELLWQERLGAFQGKAQQVVLSEVLTFAVGHRRHPFVLTTSDCPPELDALSARLESDLGIVREHHPYRPHVTLARIEPEIAPIAITPLVFVIADVHLVCSQQGMYVRFGSVALTA